MTPDTVTVTHVVLALALGFFSGLLVAYALAVITGESWPDAAGRVVDGWRRR